MEFELGGHRPKVDPDAYIAPTAVLIGQVEIEAGASVWFGAVLRADEAAIRVGRGANIQDNAVIHCAQGMPTVIEMGATIGHSALLEGCVVEEGALVGMGATMLQRSRLGARSMLAAGAVLGEGVEVPPNHLAELGVTGNDLGERKAGMLPYLALLVGLAVVLVSNWYFQLPA